MRKRELAVLAKFLAITQYTVGDTVNSISVMTVTTSAMPLNQI